MPVRSEPWPAGTPCWVDLATTDLAAARALYEELFGWTFVDSGPDFGGYLIAQKDGQATAGLGPVMGEGQPVVWTTYIATDSADDTARAVGEAGGTVLAGPMEIPGSGRMVVALDPNGASFGAWQADPMIGAQRYNEPGALVWEEASGPDPEAARAFYTAVFGWDYADVDGAGPDYRTFARGGDPLGGIGGPSEGLPPSWLHYLMCDDTDRVIAATARHGGRTVVEPSDTPYGRMAVLADAQGAVFGVIGLPPTE